MGELTLDDMYHGRQRAILSRREKIKRLTLERGEKKIYATRRRRKMGARILSKKNDPNV